METIMNYLDNMFATLPKTKQMKAIKEDIFSNMEDKYNELKRSGKSENEAVGIVISEFGNIDELKREFDIDLNEEKEDLPSLTETEVNNYFKENKKNSMLIGAGVILCLLGVSLLILIPQLVSDGYITGFLDGGDRLLIPFFILIAIATGMFTYAGMRMGFGKYRSIDKRFELPLYLRKSIEIKNETFHPTYTLSVIVGVVLSILSPITLFIESTITGTASNYGVVFQLFIISIAVYIFVYFGWIKMSYDALLKIGRHSKINK
ncbi:permease prefix domain 1-containing protein [Chengkuizengella axinellae]|uniref:Permease prefix domain 1-containing protein n=1 Tax=Chengkuizengella axinellae TaxID=3064388 RepID=A0ABT9J4B5_9BACL|nr:permease prefix domain 1-containing protein [Chengkuizengella sp. 2205SS18-9]MDP5276454.1 permease prefix domain 1-containing protein [Chengkuizengella sp. 2205SS18-9]